MTDVQFRFRKGAGSNLDVLFGTVTLKPTLAHSRGTSMVLPAPSTWDIINGEVLATNVQPTPEPVGGVLEWGYEVTVKDRHGKSYSFLVGVPDSTTAVEFVSLPRYFETKPPLFGQGPKGDAGEAATISVGTVTSGAEASVTNSGTSNDAKLDFVLPKGDKGDRGDGVPSGGTALQYLRKDSSGATTEWATVNKTTLGLSQVDNTSDANKPVSIAQGQAIEKYGKLGNGVKLPLDPPTSYDTAYSTVLGRVEDGWPALGKSATYTQISTMRSGNNYGGVIQLASAHSDPKAPIKYRLSNDDASWGEWATLKTIEGAKITMGNGALASLPENYNLSDNSTIVSLGYQAHGNMQEVRQSIAIGAGAMSQGTKSRDNIAIGDDAGWATEAYSALYDQNNRQGTRNVMVGGLSGRFNKSGIGHVLIGRGAGASIVSGRGAVIIGSNAHVSSQPIGISGQIENWANAFSGNPESRAMVVAIGETALSQNVGKNNTAVGASSLEFNTIGQYNTGVGVNTLNTIGSDTWYNGGTQRTLVNQNGTYSQAGNTVTVTLSGHGASVGDIARFRLIGGKSATFAGDFAYAEIESTTPNTYTFSHPESRNTSGESITSRIITGTPKSPSQYNTAVGGNGLKSLLTGNNNTALGYSAGANLVTGSDNTFFGYNAGGGLVSGSRNMNFGFQSGNYLTDGSAATAVENSITIGPYARVSGNNEVQIGTSAQTVYTYNAIQTRSDLRDKRDVRDTTLGLDFINALRPVDFRTAFRDNAPGDTGLGNRYHHGFIAQEILELGEFGGVQDHTVNGGADVLTVAYSELIAPIVKACQELSDRIDYLEGLK